MNGLHCQWWQNESTTIKSPDVVKCDSVHCNVCECDVSMSSLSTRWFAVNLVKVDCNIILCEVDILPHLDLLHLVASGCACVTSTLMLWRLVSCSQLISSSCRSCYKNLSINNPTRGGFTVWRARLGLRRRPLPPSLASPNKPRDCTDRSRTGKSSETLRPAWTGYGLLPGLISRQG